MPRENRKRGRRSNASKRKGPAEDDGGEVSGEVYDDDEDVNTSTQKRQKTSDREQSPAVGDPVHASTEEAAQEERPFFGLLDEQEQEYFRRADEMLEVNSFSNLEERALFLDNLHKELEGKELKIACSQSCSRLMERVILLSSPAQLKRLFATFNENLIHLLQHRFASHCCEALFTRTAPLVSEELIAPITLEPHSKKLGDAEQTPAEQLFLDAASSLTEHLGYLMTDRYGSHALRVLLLVLSGQPLVSSSRRSLLKGKAKESVEVADIGEGSSALKDARPVPGTFKTSLEDMINGTIAGLDTHHLRSLATHKTGNPTLQLLLSLELQHFGKQHGKAQASILKKLLPDEPLSEDSESGAFLNGLTFDPIGSRLLETMIEHAPGKMFKTMYKTFWKERMGSLARNEIAAYVVGKLLERLSFDDLQAAMDLVIPQIPSLVERGRTAVLRTLIERCAIRKVDTAALARALQSVYTTDDGTSFSIAKILDLPNDLPDTQVDGLPNATTILSAVQRHAQFEPSAKDLKSAKMHAALLAQAMVAVKGPLSVLIFDSLASLSNATCLYMARDPTLARVIQAALASPQASLIFRRKLIVKLYGSIGDLAVDQSGSHVVDAIWNCTANGMAFVRERVAEELHENEQAIRQSQIGRKVWRNWRMDLYKRRRADWVAQIRREAGNVGFQSFPGGESHAEADRGPQHQARPHGPQDRDVNRKRLSARSRTGIELARARFAKQRQRSSDPDSHS